MLLSHLSHDSSSTLNLLHKYTAPSLYRSKKCHTLSIRYRISISAEIYLSRKSREEEVLSGWNSHSQLPYKYSLVRPEECDSASSAVEFLGCVGMRLYESGNSRGKSDIYNDVLSLSFVRIGSAKSCARARARCTFDALVPRPIIAGALAL